MGAISMVLNAILSSGDEVLYIGGFFGGTYTLVDETLKRFGVKSSFCEVDDFKHIETTAQPNTPNPYLKNLKMENLYTDRYFQNLLYSNFSPSMHLFCTNNFIIII